MVVLPDGNHISNTMTPSCIASSGKRLIAKDVQSQRFIDRVNAVDALFCDMVRRVQVEDSILSRYCPPEPQSSSSSSPSSSDCCPLDPCPPKPPEVSYLINVTDLDQEAYDLLEILEQEACATNKKLKEFEKLNDNCNPTPTPSSDPPSLSSDPPTVSSDPPSTSSEPPTTSSEPPTTSSDPSTSSEPSSSSEPSYSSDPSGSSDPPTACNFVLNAGFAWSNGVDFNIGAFVNLGPDPVSVVSIQVLPSGVINDANPFPPYVAASGVTCNYFTPETAGFSGVIIHTTCGDYLHPFEGGTWIGNLIKL